jgi:putative membrane protein
MRQRKDIMRHQSFIACAMLLLPLAMGVGGPVSAQTPLAPADRDFVLQAAQNGEAEIEASRVAVDKGVNTQVKGFAQQMVDEHTAANEQLKALASAKGVALPDSLSAREKVRLEMLGGSDGGAFDRRYAAAWGVGAHERNLSLFQKAASGARDPDVKAYAAKFAPVLAHHLEMARALKGVVDKEGNVKAPGNRKQ